jgi:hypothetical protein
LIADQAQDITITLPAAADGLSYEFWYGGAAADTNDWIIVPTAGIFKGGVLFADTAADATTPVYADFSDDDALQVNVPDCGTIVKVVSDGTNWFLNGMVVSATAPTIA